MDSIAFSSFIPEVFLSICTLMYLVFNASLITNLNYNFPIIKQEIVGQVIFLLVCLLFFLCNSKIEGFFNDFLFLNDISSYAIKIGSIIVSLLALPSIFRGFNIQKLNFFEYFIIVLLCLLSLMLLVSASDMLSVYLVIEMQSLAFYILGGFKRNSSFSAEAGLKYFISGVFISSFFLFGCSLLYGTLGTLNFQYLTLLLSFPFDSNIWLHHIILIGIFFVTVTLFFKLLVVPFHFWSPDVYDGSPISSTLVFSVLPKITLFYFSIKWLCIIGDHFSEINLLFLGCGVLSVVFGTFFAMRQKRLKRLIIFSSISQVGFLIVALSSITLESFSSVYFFLIIYLITTLLIWSIFIQIYNFQLYREKFYLKINMPLFFSTLTNLFYINKSWALSFLIIFFSLAGIPPLSGFFAKILVILSVIESHNLFVSVFIILISGFSAFYYLKFIKTIFFEPAFSLNKVNNGLIACTYNRNFFFFENILMAYLLALLIFFFFYPENLLLLCNYIVLTSFFF